MTHLSLVEQEAKAEVLSLNVPRVEALRTVLQAHTHPRELAAAVCLNLEPMLAEARHDRELIQAQLVEADDRVAKLERLAAAAETVAVGVEEAASFRVVAGKQIALVAVQEARSAKRTEMHYDEWFKLFREAGWVIESRNPQAAFLTSLTRCALVERVGQGVYRIKEEQ